MLLFMAASSGASGAKSDVGACVGAATCAARAAAEIAAARARRIRPMRGAEAGTPEILPSFFGFPEGEAPRSTIQYLAQHDTLKIPAQIVLLTKSALPLVASPVSLT